MNQMERDHQYFLQELSRFLEVRRIHCTFEPPVGPEGCMEQTILAEVAQCLRKDTSDFDCIEEIIALLEAHGFSTSTPPRLRLTAGPAGPVSSIVQSSASGKRTQGYPGPPQAW